MGPRRNWRGGACCGADLWHGELAEEAEVPKWITRGKRRCAKIIVAAAKDHKAALGDIYNAAFSPLARAAKPS